MDDKALWGVSGKPGLIPPAGTCKKRPRLTWGGPHLYIRLRFSRRPCLPDVCAALQKPSTPLSSSRGHPQTCLSLSGEYGYPPFDGAYGRLY